MCLKKLSAEEEKAELGKLSDVFPCWRIIRKNGHCEYDVEHREPKFTRKTHIAVDQVKKGKHNYRMKLNYKPGFHACLDKMCRSHSETFKVVKCWAKKTDIVRIGYTRVGFPVALAVAVSKITRK